MKVNVTVSIEREDGYSEFSQTSHEQYVLKDEKSFQDACYNNTVALWDKITNAPTKEVRELQLELGASRKKERRHKRNAILWFLFATLLAGYVVRGLVVL